MGLCLKESFDGGGILLPLDAVAGPGGVINIPTGEDEHGIVELLCCHALEGGAADNVGDAHDWLGSIALALEEIRVEKDAGELAQIVVHGFHGGLQEGEYLWMCGLAILAPVIDGLQEAVAEGACPETVCDDLGEKRILRGGDPFREGYATLLWRDVFKVLSEEGFWGDDGFRIGIAVLVIFRETEGAGWIVDEGVFVEILENWLEEFSYFAGFAAVGDLRFVAGFHSFFFAHPFCVRGGFRGGLEIHGHPADGLLRVVTVVGEATTESGHLEILELRPIIEGVVVALGATDLATKEDLHGVTKVIQLHVSIPQVVAYGGILGCVPGGGEHFVDDSVPGLVFGKGFAQPYVPAEAELFLLRLDAEEVCCPVEKMAVETGGGGEEIDEIGAFVA